MSSIWYAFNIFQQSSVPLFLHRVTENLEPVSWEIRAQCRGHSRQGAKPSEGTIAHKGPQFRDAKQACFGLGRKPSYLEETLEAQGEHANSAFSEIRQELNPQLELLSIVHFWHCVLQILQKIQTLGRQSAAVVSTAALHFQHLQMDPELKLLFVQFSIFSLCPGGEHSSFPSFFSPPTNIPKLNSHKLLIGCESNGALQWTCNAFTSCSVFLKKDFKHNLKLNSY